MAGMLARTDRGVGPDGGASARISRWQKVVGVLGLAVVLWVGSEMYDVVFFDGFGPGPVQDTPVENQNRDDSPTPPTGDVHDPSQFDH